MSSRKEPGVTRRHDSCYRMIRKVSSFSPDKVIVEDLEENQLDILYQWVQDEDDIELFTSSMKMKLPTASMYNSKGKLNNISLNNFDRELNPTINEDFTSTPQQSRSELTRNKSMNIIEALIKVGYSVSTEMQKKENYKNKNGLQASDVAKMMEFKSNFLINKSYVSQRKEEVKENVIYLRLYRREYSKSPHGKQKRYISPSRIKRREKNSSLNYPRNRSNSKIPSMKYKQKVDSIYGTEKFMLPKIRSPKGSPYVRNIFSERSKVGASFKSSDLRGGITNIDEETFRSLKELHEIKMRNLRRVSNNGSSVFSNHEYTRSRAFSGVRESTSSEIVSATVELLSQKPSSIGASSNQGYSNSITTKDRSIRLNMPSHKYAVPLPQKRFADMAFSC